MKVSKQRNACLQHANGSQAKKKPVDKVKPGDLGVDLTPRLETIKVTEPPQRKGGLKVESVDELVSKLKELGAV